MILAQFAHLTSQAANLAMFDDQPVDFSLLGLWAHMGYFAKGIAVVLFIMSIWSLAVMIDRYLYFSAARKQSREFAPKVAGALKDSKLDEAIKIADRSKKSHLAEVVQAGLQEFKSVGGAVNEETIASAERALERAESIVHAKLKRGLSVLATVGATAPFVGLLGTVMGILNALIGIGVAGQASIDKVAGPVGEALIMTFIGLFVAVPAVLLYNFLVRRNKMITEKLRGFAGDLQAYLISKSK